MVAVLLILFNLAIATFNAYSVGRIRTEMALAGHKPAGLEAWTLNSARWSSILCFTVPIAFVVMLILSVMLPQDYSSPFLKISGGMLYLTVVPPLVDMGLIITLHSIKEAFDPNAKMLNRGIAVYNTAASIHNVVELASTMPKMFSMIGEGFSAAGKVAAAGEDEAAPIMWGLGAGVALVMIAISAVIIGTCGGAYIAHLIERWGAGSAVAEAGVTRDMRLGRS
jgi:hypothetical protein